jgi:putative ABC transport system substrate-binding protein
MRRRDFIIGIGSTSVWPLAAQAQQNDRIPHLGVLAGYSASNPLGQMLATVLGHGLAASGWRDGENLRVDWRWAGGDAKLYERYAAELVALGPEVFLAQTSLAVEALRRQTKTIPIVFVIVTDPVGQGFVTSLAHPGGNVTGFSDYDPPIAGKWVELLTQITPPVGRIAVLYNPASTPFASQILQAVEAAAPRFAVTAQAAPCRDDGDIDSTMAELARKERGGALIVPEVFTAVHRDAIVAAAAEHRVPAIYPNRISSTRSELMTYGVDPEDLFRGAAGYVDRLLRGANPTDLPVQNPTKFLLTINLTTVKSLGLTIPPSLLATAEEVIE